MYECIHELPMGGFVKSYRIWQLRDKMHAIRFNSFIRENSKILTLKVAQFSKRGKHAAVDFDANQSRISRSKGFEFFVISKRFTLADNAKANTKVHLL